MSFICSSNNNVKRISLMLDRLRARYGLFLCSLRQDSSGDWAVYTDSEDSGDGSETDKRHEDSIRLYTFPTVVALATAQEEDLRALGVGYRARFITGSAGIAATKGPAWLLGLRQRQRLEVVDELLALPGVGRKVADCVALFR
jgi:3-methyladenine DNA glycosylase/8-oxoguanine DNA glycosylase